MSSVFVRSKFSQVFKYYISIINRIENIHMKNKQFEPPM